MGRAKALLPWRGRPLVAHITAVLREVVGDVVIASSPDLELPSLEGRVIRDRIPGLGPLGGIRDALLEVERDLAFVTSVDAPFLSARFVRRMLEFGEAAAPVIEGSIVQSVAAVYPRARARIADELIAARRLRPLYLLEAGGYRQVAPHELPDLDSLRSVNTPEAYLDALRDDGAGGTATIELLGSARAWVGRERLEVQPASLREVLGQVEELAVAGARTMRFVRDGIVAQDYLVSLNGQQMLRDGAVPIGPGDNIIVMDAAK